MSCHQPTNRGVSSVDILCLKIYQTKEGDCSGKEKRVGGNKKCDKQWVR